MREGTLTSGVLEVHRCPAKMKVYVPECGLRAIIVPLPAIPNSHPSFPRAKVTRAAREEYNGLIETSGRRPTVLSIEKGIVRLLL